MKKPSILLILIVVLMSIAILPVHAQLSCDLPPSPLDDPAFVDQISQSFWNITDFCQFKDGVIDEIGSGGVPPDGIPPIDDPAFDSIAEAGAWLEPQSPVIAFDIAGDARAYPLSVLTRHEIANDIVGDVPVAVTFCPLCNSAIVFDRRVDGETLRFGVSGLLRNSDLVMWDDLTKSWWQQFTGEGIVGTYTGVFLDIVPSQVVSFEAFSQQYPEGIVLNGSESAPGIYGSNPYVGYDTQPGRPFLFQGELDIRLQPTERVLGANFGDVQVAYTFTALEEEQVVNDTINGMDIVAIWQPGAASALDGADIASSRDVGMAGLFQRTLDGEVLTFSVDTDGNILDDQTESTWNVFGTAVAGSLEGTQLEQINAFPHFWFAWAAFFPDTEVYGEIQSSEVPDRYDLEPVLGNPNAPVTIVEYGAYGCHSCKLVHEQGWIQDVLEEYAGQVNFVFRDFPVIDPQYSMNASEVAQCALDQSEELYWAFHDAMFIVARQGASSQADMIEIAGTVGLDRDALRSCVDAGTYTDVINYFVQRGQNAGIFGTPTFFVNDQQLFTPSPDFLRELIDQELAMVNN